MDRFETSLEIDQPPSRVFEFLIDRENRPLWQSDFFRGEQLRGEWGEKGSLSREIFIEEGKRVEFIDEITEANEDRLLEEHLHNDAADFKVRSEIVPAAQGRSTFLRVAVEYMPKSFRARLRHFFNPAWLRRKYEKDLSNLKEAVEAYRG